MNKKDKIIEATIDIISCKGLKHATLANILKKSNTGYGTLYNYFTDKEDLHRQVISFLHGKLAEYVFVNYDNSDDPLDKFSLIIGNYIDFSLAYKKYYIAMATFNNTLEYCDVASSNYDYSCVKEEFITCIHELEARHIFKVRQPLYNFNIIMGIINASLDYFDGKSDERLKGEVINICMNAIR